MARADLLCELIKSSLDGNQENFRRTAEALCAEEQAKQHRILADKIRKLLSAPNNFVLHRSNLPLGGNDTSNFCQEKTPERTLDSLFLSENIGKTCRELIEEQHRSDLLQSYGLTPRNKLLLIGPPGNGKTSLAEAIAESLYVPFLTVKYESIVGAYLGETANKLAKMFDYARSRRCVLFFDEFETLGKERGDLHETGEIKRVVSSLLLQIDSLPSYVVVIAATNHDELLDRAVWRRFQIRLSIPKPTRKQLQEYFLSFEARNEFSFGYETDLIAKELDGICYAEAEEFALAVFRRYILQGHSGNMKTVTQKQIIDFKEQRSLSRSESR